MKLSVISLGCAKNFADMEGVLANMSRFELASESDADIVLLNTCGFLASARDEVFQNIKRLRRKKVVILGCLAGKFRESDFKKYKQIYGIVSEASYGKIDDILRQIARGEKIYMVSPEPAKFEHMAGKILLMPSRAYAYIKIAEGCNNFCSYCLIPYLRGRYRSRPMDDIIEEARGLFSCGIKEIVLVAQDCGFYGVDLYGEKKLAELLKRLCKIEGDFWVRVLYVYPERIDDELLSVVAKEPKICKYLDVPLQHGDPGILKAMKRPSNIERVYEKIRKIREAVPCITLRTSLIVGFPGENVEAFLNLMKFVRRIDFDHVGVFEYSREKGTPACKLKGQASKTEKRLRKERIMLLQQGISRRKNQSLIGKKMRILVEGKGVGRSEKFAPEVDGEVQFSGDAKAGEFTTVKITGASEYDLEGKKL